MKTKVEKTEKLEKADKLEIKIDSNIPLPPRRGGGRSAIYPFADLKKGQSFLVMGKDTPAVSSYAAFWKKKLKTNFAVRREIDEKTNKVIGSRVFRVD